MKQNQYEIGSLIMLCGLLIGMIIGVSMSWLHWQPQIESLRVQSCILQLASADYANNTKEHRAPYDHYFYEKCK